MYVDEECLEKNTHVHVYIYRMAGYFRGVYILQILKLLQFAELIFVKLIENHTHVPSVYTCSNFTGAIFAEFFIS